VRVDPWSARFRLRSSSYGGQVACAELMNPNVRPNARFCAHSENQLSTLSGASKES
jgi:hypothetical protein